MPLLRAEPSIRQESGVAGWQFTGKHLPVKRHNRLVLVVLHMHMRLVVLIRVEEAQIDDQRTYP